MAYVYPSPQHAHRPRAYSSSYSPPMATGPIVYTSSHHSSPGRRATYIPQAHVYAPPAPQYAAQAYRPHTSHHHGHARAHSAGSAAIYAQPAPAPAHHRTHHEPTRRSPHRTSTSAARPRASSTHAPRSSPPRSHSVPRSSSRVRAPAPDAHHSHHHHRSSSRPREPAPILRVSASSGSHSQPHSRHSSFHAQHEPLGERIRRMFGFGRDRHVEFMDARTGRFPVDRRGRPIYAV